MNKNIAWVAGIIVLIALAIYFTYPRDTQQPITTDPFLQYNSQNEGQDQNNEQDQANQDQLVDTTTTNNNNTQTNQLQSNQSQQNNNSNKPMDVANKTVTLRTNKGNITIQLNSTAPVAASNFYKLASEGFYDGVRFHRVIEGFMIQGGDPQSKDPSLKGRWGTGGPGYQFVDELSGDEKYTVGTVAMANSGPNTNGSQFFIMTADYPLPPSYTVFGKVISGVDVALAIEKVETNPVNDMPLEDIIITSATVE